MSKLAMQSYIIGRYDELCDRPELRQFYDDTDFINYGYWDVGTKNQRQACENLTEHLLSFIPKNTGTILDVACGKWETTAYLRKYYAPQNVAAINISEKQLRIARTKVLGSAFLMMDASDLGFVDNSFDNIICVEAVFHFYTRDKFLHEAHRVLKPGGSLVLSDILMTLEGEKSRESHTEENYVEDLEEYRSIWERAGFRQLEVVDATKQCWEGYFWYVMRYFHQKMLAREIGVEELHQYLQNTYRIVPHMRSYVLARGMKM